MFNYCTVKAENRYALTAKKETVSLVLFLYSLLIESFL